MKLCYVAINKYDVSQSTVKYFDSDQTQFGAEAIRECLVAHSQFDGDDIEHFINDITPSIEEMNGAVTEITLDGEEEAYIISVVR